MCFNLIAISKKRNLLILLPDLVEKIITNPHGFFLYTKKYIRTLDRKDFIVEMVKELILSKEIHIHFRLASSGVISVENVHGWKVGEFYVSHNGHVLEYTTNTYNCRCVYYTWRGREIKIVPYEVIEVKSDTYKLVHDDEFIEHLENRDFEKLYKFMDGKGFIGVMLINSEDFDEVYAISQMKSVKVYRSKDTVILSNDVLSIGNMDFEEYNDCVIGIGKNLDVKVLYKSDKPKKVLPQLDKEDYDFYEIL